MASALLALEPVVVDQSDLTASERLDLSALPVDEAWHVYLDLEAIGDLDVPTIGFWLIHQVSHLLRNHAARSPLPPGGPSRPSAHRTPEQRRWNLATDAEINDDLVAGDTSKPGSAVTPGMLELPDAWTAEQYWDALAGREPASEGKDPDVEGCDCGSGCDGVARPWDNGESGVSETGRKLVERDVARRIREHQRRYGDTPAGWQRWADEVLEPTISWQRVLA
jgi:predicted metal-dependent peptidase